MKNPKISVIMPVRNAGTYIAKAIEGLEKLDFDSWELIIVDDASTDDTALVIGGWIEATSLDTTLISYKTPHGVAAARNAGVEQAVGQFVWFVDADDSWSPAILGHLWSGATEPTMDMVVCDAIRVVEKTDHVSKIWDAPREEIFDGIEALHRVLTGELQGHLWNKIIRTSLLRRHSFPEMRSHSDLAGVIKISANCRQVATVPGVHYYYNVHAGSILNSADYRWETLFRCAKVAEATIQHVQMDGKMRRDLDFFKASLVMIPAANHLSLMTPWEPARIPYRNRVTFSLVVNFVLRGQRALAAKSLTVRYAPRLYRAIYRRRHAKKWGLK